jgi:2-oxo-4-hydroxy-4-carboxy-5-ureidoimidazoline decarboxylase
MAMIAREDAMLKDVNEMAERLFHETLGWVFEHSPWVMERVGEKRPFSSWEVLLMRMEEAVLLEASHEEQLMLLRAHPDLGGKLEMSQASVQEQKGAGLDQLEPAEYIRFSACNQAYTDKFQIPFIMAVRGQSKDAILAAMRRRLEGEHAEEVERALREVVKIAQFRLWDTLEKRLVQRLSASGRITTHVLDLSSGQPAAGLRIELWQLDLLEQAANISGGTRLAEAVTGADGRLLEPLVAGAELVPGSYRLVFHAGDYYAGRGAGGAGGGSGGVEKPADAGGAPGVAGAARSSTVFDRIVVDFTLEDASQHYHIPLLIAPGGYSTYRGS